MENKSTSWIPQRITTSLISTVASSVIKEIFDKVERDEVESKAAGGFAIGRLLNGSTILLGAVEVCVTA